MNNSELNELLVEELRDIYHAEKQLVKALPKMAKACDSEELTNAFHAHLAETEGQVARLEEAFELLEVAARGKTCKGMAGLIEEGSEVLKERKSSRIRDLTIIAAAQRIENYEISAYATARALADHIGNKQVANLLRQSETEEITADDKLGGIASTLYITKEPEEEEEELALAGNGRARAATRR